MPYIDVWSPGSPALVLLHGTGGDEHQLMEVAEGIAPGWGRLGLRGQVSEGGALRYFRRFAEGQLDLEDMVARVDAIADHLRARFAELGIERAYALGYSNGANVAVGLLLRHPELLTGAVLWRPMNPLPAGPTLVGRRVLITASQSDTITPPAGAAGLASMLEESGAEVSLEWVPGGHSLSRVDFQITQEFLNHA